MQQQQQNKIRKGGTIEFNMIVRQDTKIKRRRRRQEKQMKHKTTLG